MKIVSTYDRSDLILRSIATLKEKLIEESLIVSAVIVIFLFHLRSALVAIVTLPIAIILSFIAIYYYQPDFQHHVPWRDRDRHRSDGRCRHRDGGKRAQAPRAMGRSRAAGRSQPGSYRGGEGSREAAIFSLLIIAVSFLPIFTLEAPAGRLFRPLAFTKTFAMFSAAFLSITLAPVLMVLLIRGRVRPETRNPMNRLLIALYTPVVKGVLRFRKTTIALAISALILSYPAFARLGSEFMPPLNEGDILYMPTALPGLSIGERTEAPARQTGRHPRRLPRGRAHLRQGRPRRDPHQPRAPQHGRDRRHAETTRPVAGCARPHPLALRLDPRPSSTRAPSNCRRTDPRGPGTSWSPSWAGTSSFPGRPGSAYTMPIRARVDMLTTGVRTPVGVKVFGPDLASIEEIGASIETVLNSIPGTRSVCRRTA